VVTKSRNQRFRASPWSKWDGVVGSSPLVTDDHGVWYANGEDRLLYSENHGNYRSRLGKHDVGGAFHSLTHELSEQFVGPKVWRAASKGSADNNKFVENYQGSYFAKFSVIADAHFPSVPIALDSELDQWGTTAIARVLPTNPLAGLAVAFGELKREGIPAVLGANLMKEKIGRARGAGAEYLNSEFGWRPLVNEVLSLVGAIERSDKILKSYEDNSGTLIRRTYTWPLEITTSETSTTGNYPSPALRTQYWSSTGTLTTFTKTTVKKWFEGVFTYYLAPQGSMLRKEQIAAKQFGHRITPEVLWNLTPWSWAADWVSNIGDVIHNISAFQNDGLVMPWGYSMCQTTKEVSYHISGARSKYDNIDVACSQTLTSIRRQRKKATPFGFGLELDGFSNRQWAILGALGLTRSPRSLA